MISVSTSGDGTFVRLDSQSSSWILASIAGGLPELLYIGDRLPSDFQLEQLRTNRDRPVQRAALDDPEPLTLLPHKGAGYLGQPGMAVHRAGEDFIVQLRCDDVESSQHQVVFRCSEPLSNFSVDLSIALDEQSEVISLHSAITNRDPAPLNVEWLAAACIALPYEHSEVVFFGGRWAREYRASRLHLDTATLLKENRHGRTSHESFPALVTGQPAFNEVRGDVLAAHLAWSGNHRLLAERSRDGRPLIQLGELLEPGELVLLENDSYCSPNVHLSRSSSGTNHLMTQHHRFVRQRLIPPYSARPVHFNTWEACYFDLSEQRTLALVQQATALGAERFVLDDGWFVGRNSELAGLGDWTVCPKAFPRGLEPVIKAVEDAGMQFGLWIEPEMVSTDSNLYRQHPDWALGDPRRRQPIGRHQLMLNLDREDVFDHLLSTITGLIERYGLGYIKWDMNRDLTHVPVAGKPGNHLITHASYRLMAAVRETCPGTEIEICSSGGARADYAALGHGHRIWTSDNHDPHDRQRIQRNFSLFFPPEVMGAHVGGSPNEISGRLHPMGFRVANALSGHFGVEPTKDPFSPEEQACLRAGIAFYKAHRDWLHQGATYYLPHRDPNLLARLQISQQRDQALLTAAQLRTPTDGVPLPLRLVGLHRNTHYQVHFIDLDTFTRQSTYDVNSDLLEQQGLQLPILNPDSAVLVELTC